MLKSGFWFMSKGHFPLWSSVWVTVTVWRCVQHVNVCKVKIPECLKIQYMHISWTWRGCTTMCKKTYWSLNRSANANVQHYGHHLGVLLACFFILYCIRRYQYSNILNVCIVNDEKGKIEKKKKLDSLSFLYMRVFHAIVCGITQITANHTWD